MTVISTEPLTGQEVSKIAYTLSGIPPVGLGLATEILIYLLTIACTGIVGLRIWVRTWRPQSKQKWTTSDWLAVIGFSPFIPASVLGVLAVRYGVGAPDSYLDTFEYREFLVVRGMEYLMWYEMVYFGASTITKFAIAFTILQICTQKKYVYLMYGTMGLMAFTAVGCLIWLFSNCTPFEAYWNPKLGTCNAAGPGFLTMSYIGTSAQIVTDWTCAITPFFVVHSLQMPRRTKISVIGVLGLGVLASVAAIMRIVSYKYIDIQSYPDNHWFAQGQLLFWSLLESSFAIIACSLPSLRKLFTICLGRSTNRSGGNTAGGSKLGFNETPLHHLGPNGQLRTTVSTMGKWDRLQDDDSSGRHIIKDTEVHVETGSHVSDLKDSEV